MKKFLLFLILISGCAGESPATYKDVTSNYRLPPELEGYKIIILGGGWSNTYPLWVIIPPPEKTNELPKVIR